MPDIQDVAHAARNTLGEKGVIVLVANHDGTVGFAASGIGSHFEANLLLSVGIHMNLKAHDAQVLAGSAGAEAQAVAESLEVQS